MLLFVDFIIITITIIIICNHDYYIMTVVGMCHESQNFQLKRRRRLV